ncbi:hypothetical protein AB0J52_26470 [Spirillospora sp. NPDC049652]
MHVFAAPHRRRVSFLAAAAASLLAAVLVLVSCGSEEPGARVVRSAVKGSDGKTYWVENHLVRDHGGPHRREWVLAWAGAEGSPPAKAAATGHPHSTSASPTGAVPPDFLAVIDATKGSPTYGKVMNTATIGPLTQGEPHHMQYIWHKGQRVYAGTMFADTDYVFDVSRLPEVRLTGVALGKDTPCGSVPDAFWTTKDGYAYGSYLGGPDVSGPCTYSDGQVRVGNGFGGTPGELIRLDPKGRVTSETAAATRQSEDRTKCHSVPQLPVASCANPHGLQVREDLNRLVLSDFAEARNYLDPDTKLTDPTLLRNSVRIFDIANRDRPKLLSVSYLPTGPREDQFAAFDEDRMVMENALASQPSHRGLFASTMAGGVIYFTPDVMSPHPVWQEVFDSSTAYKRLGLNPPLTGSNAGSSWLALTPDDRYLFQTVMGSDPRHPLAQNSGMLFVLDVRKLLAAGPHPRCRIDTQAEITAGGADPDCPPLVGAEQIKGGIGGPQGRVGIGPHWGSMDHFQRGPDGYYHETTQIKRVVTADYFIAKAGIDGDHKICMTDFDPRTGLTLDTSFKDENTGQPCVAFDRESWPHGTAGHARPHGVLFAVSDSDVR